MSYRYDSYTDSFIHIPDEQPNTAVGMGYLPQYIIMPQQFNVISKNDLLKVLAEIDGRLRGIAGAKKTNADCVRQMTDEELAEIIACVGNCGDCFLHHNGCDIRTTCKGNVLEWLKREANDGQAEKGNS